MKLSPRQIQEFDQQGYLFFPDCFSEMEIALLRDDAENGANASIVSSPRSSCTVRVIPTDEEAIIARETARFK